MNEQLVKRLQSVPRRPAEDVCREFPFAAGNSPVPEKCTGVRILFSGRLCISSSGDVYYVLYRI